WQNPEQLFVAQELINKVKSKCCGIKVIMFRLYKNHAQVPWAFDTNNKKGGKRFAWKFLLPEN
ncbi:hypothetical protein, partial [Bacteroides ovatus]|uniref:hypothetical protein n=1 Tax=Bacteroides ovatus TaxID=28116 RepID=UPI001E2B12C5